VALIMRCCDADGRILRPDISASTIATASPPVVSLASPNHRHGVPRWCAGSRHLHRLDRSHRQPSNGARTPLRVRFVRQQQVGSLFSMATFRLLPGYSKKPLPNGLYSRVTPKRCPGPNGSAQQAPHQCRRTLDQLSFQYFSLVPVPYPFRISGTGTHSDPSSSSASDGGG